MRNMMEKKLKLIKLKKVRNKDLVRLHFLKMDYQLLIFEPPTIKNILLVSKEQRMILRVKNLTKKKVKAGVLEKKKKSKKKKMKKKKKNKESL